MTELKPCPFCGEPAVVVRVGTSRQSTIIECENCAAQVESGDQEPMHCNSWNRRPIEDALRAEVARLQAKLARYEADLTGPQQVAIVESINLPVVSTNTVRIFDAAIRKVRGEP